LIGNSIGEYEEGMAAGDMGGKNREERDGLLYV